MNFKTTQNPAKAPACKAACLVFAENHHFAWIFVVLKERVGASHGQKVLFLLPFKRKKKTVDYFLTSSIIEVMNVLKHNITNPGAIQNAECKVKMLKLTAENGKTYNDSI